MRGKPGRNIAGGLREIADIIKRMVGDPARHPLRYGLVKAVDATTGMVKVEIVPDGVETDFIRYKGPGMSLGKWRGIFLPAIDTEVMLEATDPDHKGYIAVGGLYNGVDLPPGGYVPETMLWQHTDTGNKVLLDVDGMVYLGDKTGAYPIVLQPWIADYFNPLVAYVNALRLAFNAHAHGGPFGGGPPPLPQVPTAPVSWASGDVTQKCKGA